METEDTKETLGEDHIELCANKIEQLRKQPDYRIGNSQERERRVSDGHEAQDTEVLPQRTFSQ